VSSGRPLSRSGAPSPRTSPPDGSCPASPHPGRRRSGDGVTRLYYPKIIRRWAEANRVELPKRGRIPQRIIEQFEAHEETRRR